MREAGCLSRELGTRKWRSMLIKKAQHLLETLLRFLRRSLFFVLAFGPMPGHIAFIMDGNRRYTKIRGVKPGMGHNAGFSSLVSILQYCYEMGVKYVTVYAFSIDNFKRKPEEVQSLMNLMQEKIDELLREDSVVSKYGVIIHFLGGLNLLNEPARLAAEKAMTNTAKNTGPVLSICVAYTSTHEILNSVQESFAEKKKCIRGSDLISDDYTKSVISVADLEQHMYTKDCPEPDILVRTSGVTRLSNFLLWQTTYCHLQNPIALWPELSFKNLVWSILEYQKVYPYLNKKRSSSVKI